MNTNRINKFVILLGLLGCSSEAPQISFQVSPVFEANGKNMMLQLLFTSDKSVNLLVDWDALSVYDPRPENDLSLNDKLDLLEIVGRLHHSQFIIENRNREKRFFSDIRIFDGESIQMKSIFRIDPDIDTIRLGHEHKVVVTSGPIEINRFKNSESDEEVRIYYLFKPTEDQRSQGFKPIVLVSNWLRLRP